MEFIIIGIVTALNLIIILKKVSLGRYEDAVIDTSLFIFVVAIFSGTYSGMVVGMIASMVVSIYLYKNPPNYFQGFFKSDKASIIWHNIKTMNPDGPTAPKKRQNFEDL
jgi:tetrahydromethanopterin S-methyltransferase subunit F